MLNIKKRGLGKGLQDLGLNELLSETSQTHEAHSDLRTLPIDQLQPGRYQPRQEMNKESLEELANSIRAQGVLQPLIVRSIAENLYEIIAGERRWRAAQLAELQELPVIIREMSDKSSIAVALIENIQREDLNAIDTAIALQRLMTEFELTHEQAATAVGKARATVSNLLRLLDLNDDVKLLLQTHQIEMGHARALLATSGQQQSVIAKIIITRKLSVRETEQLIRQYENSTVKKPATTRNDHLTHLQKNLSDKLGAHVSIQHQSNGHGKLVVQYNSLEELQGIIEHIN